MASKPVAPMITDPMEFIRNANAMPAQTIVGGRADELAETARAATPEPVPAVAPAKSPSPAKKAASEKKEKKTDPWDEANPKVTRFFQVRMPEPLNIKLQWLVDNSVGRHSMHSIALDAIEKEVEARIAEIKKRAG